MNGTYETLSAKALKLLRITGALQGLFLFLTLAIPALFLIYENLTAESATPSIAAIWDGVGIPSASLLALGLVLAAFCMLLLPRLRHRRYRYLIDADRLEIIEGLFYVHRKIIPIDRVHQIEIARGPLDKLAGVAKVVITTAGSQSAFRFLEPERAEQIALYLNETIAKKLQVRAARGENDV